MLVNDHDELLALSRRIAALEDERAILGVLHRYGHTIDYGDEAGWLDCFTEDAVWEARTAVGVTRHTGHGELSKFIAGHTRAPELLHKHIAAQAVVALEGDTAASTCYYILLFAAPGRESEIAAFGRYVDHLRREPDGKWRFTERIAEADTWNPMWGALRDIRRKKLAGSD